MHPGCPGNVSIMVRAYIKEAVGSLNVCEYSNNFCLICQRVLTSCPAPNYIYRVYSARIHAYAEDFICRIHQLPNENPCRTKGYVNYAGGGVG